MHGFPSASVIIPVWNGRDCMLPCLQAICAQDYPDSEIVVVDNASPDGAGDLIAHHYPQVRLLRAPSNLGFSGGCNLGLSAAKGDLLILLNQDTIVSPGWLRALAETFLADTTIGIVGCKTLYPDGTIQHAGGMVNIRGEGYHIGAHERDCGQYDSVTDVDFVTGAALMIAREVYAQVGDLDVGFSPVYYEDVDWCYRVRAAGFRVVYAPSAVLVHAEHSLASSMSHEGMYSFHRNRLRFVLKHWSSEELLQFTAAEQEYLCSVAPGGERLIAALLRSYLYHLLILDDLIQWRIRLYGSTIDAVDTLASALLRLRSTVSLPEDVGPDSISERTHLIADLHQLASIQTYPLEPKTKWGGRILKALRKWVYDYLTSAYIAPLVQQQTVFNQQVITALESGLRDRTRLADVLIEYDLGMRREISDLGLELRRLQKD